MSIFTSVKKGYVKFSKDEEPDPYLKTVKIEDGATALSLSVTSKLRYRQDILTDVQEELRPSLSLSVEAKLIYRQNIQIDVQEELRPSLSLSVESSLKYKQNIDTDIEDGKTGIILYVLASLQEV